MLDPDAVFYVCISAASFTFFLGIFLLSPWISKYVSSSYKDLPVKKQIDWNTRIGSNIHAVIAVAISVFVLLCDKDLSTDHFRTDARLGRCGISITFGYILADLLIILWYYEHFCNILYVIHHIMALWAYIYVVTYGYLIYFANIRQVAELSTPFVNQRWFYDAVGYPRDSRYFIANGLLMAFSFFVGRIMFMPFFYYKTFSVWSYPQRIALGPILSFYWIMTAGTLDVINLIWFKKMVSGAAKLLLNKQEKEKKLE